MESYYDLLGVSEDATTAEIKAAYRERLKETHPDVSDDADASDRTKVLIEAKEVLVDDEERARYDRLGHQQYVATEGQPGDASEPPDAGQAATGPTDSESESETEETVGGSGDSTTPGGTGTDRSSGWTGSGWSEASQDAWDAAGTEQSGTRRDQRAPRDSWSSSSGSQTGTAAASSTSTRDADWRAWNTGGAFSVRNDSGLGRDAALLTRRKLTALSLAFLFYPVLLGTTIFPGTPLLVRVVVGGCTLFVVAWLQSISEVGIVVFGAWSLLVPVIFTSLGLPLFSPLGLAALGGTVLPLGLTLLTRTVIRL